MSLIKKRQCPECRGEMHPQLINMVYTKMACELQVEVIGIPANVCTHCFYRIIPGKVAQYIDTLIDSIFEVEMRQQEKILPTPHIDIQFPPVERSVYAYS